uniref:Ig-like domain-containing protein n=1 Tax=Oreochromis niloticus TaxID=8128 RepID=A0A669DNQ7_ORENI
MLSCYLKYDMRNFTEMFDTIPSVSLLQPSSEKLSGGPVTLACLLTGYSPQGAEVRWEVDGTEVTEGVLNSLEEEKSSRYSSSSTLMLSQENWMNAEVFSCREKLPFNRKKPPAEPGSGRGGAICCDRLG